MTYNIADVDHDGVPELFLGVVSAPDAGGFVQNGVYLPDEKTHPLTPPVREGSGISRQSGVHHARQGRVGTLDRSKALPLTGERGGRGVRVLMIASMVSNDRLRTNSSSTSIYVPTTRMRASTGRRS